MSDIEWVLARGVGLLTLNRPEKRNALSAAMIAECADLLTRAQDDPAVRALVITGAGTAFCAGGDISPGGEVTALPGAESVGSPQVVAREHLKAGIHRIPLALEALDKPVIAAVNGAAVGAGMDLALMCDIRFVAASARMSEGYIRAGLVPGDGGCYFLPRIVGIGKALELLLGGEFIDSDTALTLGIANRCYADEILLEKTMEFASHLAASPPIHIQLTKRNVYESASSSLRTSLELAASHMAIVRSLNDSQEALEAFKAGRTGTYNGT